MAGSPEYSTLTLPQKQLPVGMMIGWSFANTIKERRKFEFKSSKFTVKKGLSQLAYTKSLSSNCLHLYTQNDARPM